MGDPEVAHLMDTSLLKREALMFSRIAIPTLHEILSSRGESSEFQRVCAELAWLHEREIVFEPEFAAKNQILNDEYQGQIDSLRQHGKDVIRQIFGLDLDELEATRKDKTKIPEVRKKLDKLSEMSADDLMAIFESSDLLDSVMLMTGSLTRMMSIELRELMHLEAFPVLTRRIPAADNRQANKGDVVEIVLNALPVPDESTAWERILEYRNDPESLSKFLSLRNWMNKVARSGLTTVEVEDELEFLVDQYEQHLKLHRMKTKTGSFETIIVAGAEFFEDLAKRNFSKLAKGMFALRHREIALLEQELAAPGREVAYVISAREQFA